MRERRVYAATIFGKTRLFVHIPGENRSMKNIHRISGLILLLAAMLCASEPLRGQTASETPRGGPATDELSPWRLGLGGGYIRYEGDEAIKDGFFGLLRLAYDYTPRWTIRGEISYFPELKANTVLDYETGEPVSREGLHGDSTWAIGLAADALFHIAPASGSRWDPYLAGGIGLLYYDEKREWRARADVPIRAGIGLACHLTPSWSVNVDVMEHMTIDKQEFNFVSSAGISWRPPAGPKPARSAGLVPAAAAAGIAELPAGQAAPAAAQAPAAKPPEPEPADLRMFKVDMDSAEGKWHEYFSELDAIAKIIHEYPGSEILVEGHMNRQPNVSEAEARRLTGRKAEAVRDYFVKNHKIEGKRITALGLGFSLQPPPGDPDQAYPDSQRMIIRIRAAKR